MYDIPPLSDPGHSPAMIVLKRENRPMAQCQLGPTIGIFTFKQLQPGKMPGPVSGGGGSPDPGRAIASFCPGTARAIYDTIFFANLADLCYSENKCYFNPLAFISSLIFFCHVTEVAFSGVFRKCIHKTSHSK